MADIKGKVVKINSDFIGIEFTDGQINDYFSWRFDTYPRLDDNVIGNHHYWKVIPQISWQECGF